MNYRVIILFLALTFGSIGLFLISGSDVSAQVANCDRTQRLCNPLGDNNMSVSKLFYIVLDAINYVGAVVAVCFVIYSGFLFVTAGGNDKKIDQAKNTLLYTLIGVAILFGAQIIVSIVTSTLQEVKNAAQ